MCTLKRLIRPFEHNFGGLPCLIIPTLKMSSRRTEAKKLIIETKVAEDENKNRPNANQRGFELRRLDDTVRRN